MMYVCLTIYAMVVVRISTNIGTYHMESVWASFTVLDGFIEFNLIR